MQGRSLSQVALELRGTRTTVVNGEAETRGTLHRTAAGLNDKPMMEKPPAPHLLFPGLASDARVAYRTMCSVPTAVTRGHIWRFRKAVGRN